MIRLYSQPEQGQDWLERYRGAAPIFACVLGFTETGLIPGISAAGATPADRQYTAIADAEFLCKGCQPSPRYPLPPLSAGVSPVFITRSIVTQQQIPVYVFNAGLPHAPAVPTIDLGGVPARCLSQANAMDHAVVHHLWQQGLLWGEKLAAHVPEGYVILSECVVGGTTTALALLAALGWDALGKVNSSHPTCNHQQKWQIVEAGLHQLANRLASIPLLYSCPQDPWQIVAALGDPMQIAVAGMAIAASRTCGVLLAGGTQMLAVHALMQAIGQAQAGTNSGSEPLLWQPEQVVVGTTRWVAEDQTGDTIGLAEMLRVPLLATQLSFANSRYAQLRAYERGFVKEGVGAGGCAIAASLYQMWGQTQLLQAIESLIEDYCQIRQGDAVN